MLVSVSFSQTQFRFDINRIVLPIDNRGNLAEVNINPFGSGGKLDNVVFLFSAGFFMSGYAGDSLWSNGVAPSSLVLDYVPGIVGGDLSEPKNVIYTIKRSDPPFGISWQNWSDAVSMGASFYDGNGDGIYNPLDLNSNGTWDINEDKPDILGDLTAWCVYNDGLPASQRRYNVESQGIEIHQTVFCYDSLNFEYPELGNTIFVRYRIINKGTSAEVLDSVIFGLWSDPDIGEVFYDKVGSDTLLSSVFDYSSSENFEYGVNPPAVYATLLQLPHVYIPGITFIDNNSNGDFDIGIDNPLDSAIYYYGQELGAKIIPGAQNTTNASSMGYRKADVITHEPRDKYECRNYLLARLDKGQIVNPCDFYFTIVAGGINCSEINPFYWASGDPVDSVGWLWKLGGDIRIMANTGVFQLIKDEPVDIIAAYTAVRGVDAINSISVTRETVKEVLSHYYSNFGQFPTGIEVDGLNLVTEFKLYQNYPNPFNPTTKIKYSIPSAVILSEAKNLVTLKVFDILGNEIATLVNDYKPTGSYEVEFQSSVGSRQMASGIYYYQLRVGAPESSSVQDFVQTKKMILLK